MNVTGVYWWSVNIGPGNGFGAIGQQAITWANVDLDLCHHMVSLDQNELIDVIVLVLQAIHHNIISFCNICWKSTEYENNIKYMHLWCTQNYLYVICCHFG